MTDNENVASTEEAQNEPVPNPYNMRKSWHTEDVMPKKVYLLTVYLLNLKKLKKLKKKINK